MATRVEQLEAELVVARLEEKLEKAKGTKKGPGRALKQELRDARLRHRAARDGLTVTEDDRGRLVAE